MAQTDAEKVWAYHQATKHHFHRYARSAGYMDWNNQPVPFRFYEEIRRISLDLAAVDPDVAYDDLYTPPPARGQAFVRDNLGLFLELSLGLSAWKAAGGSRWSLRINPSSGNLHPTEGYVIVPEAPGIISGVYHYNPLLHALELRESLDSGIWSRMEAHFGGPGFLVALSSIFWRESWKYGERAFRYCNLDVGHALAALAFSARMQHWRFTCLNCVSDDQINTLLGFDRTSWRPLEKDESELIGWVSVKSPSGDVAQDIPQDVVQFFADRQFSGTPNALSRHAVDWTIIDRTAAATKKPLTPSRPWECDPFARSFPGCKDLKAAAVIRRRRSALSYNPEKDIPAEVFGAILECTLAVSGAAPFGVRLIPPVIHPVFFVHRVAGLAPGLYLLVRRNRMLASLRACLRHDFRWQKVMEDLPLYLLEERDVSLEAMELSCHQEIAGYGAFAAAMLAPFDDAMRRDPYLYRHLYWECGMLGQVLYLGAEAHGLRGTGIGCYFDDAVHDLLGIRDNAFQSLYHFTVGHPVEDGRLTTLTAYHHLQR